MLIQGIDMPLKIFALTKETSAALAIVVRSSGIMMFGHATKALRLVTKPSTPRKSRRLSTMVSVLGTPMKPPTRKGKARWTSPV